MNEEKELIIDPDNEEVRLSGYYSVRFYCRNCDNSTGLGFDGISVMIKKGIKKPKSITCPNCGCLTN